MKEGALHELPGGWMWTKLEDAMDREINKPQINADERRFVNLDIQHLSEVYQGNSLLKSPQRSQSFAIPATAYEPAPPSRRGTRMTRIGRIFTDMHESASSIASILYRIPSAFICVHLRLIFVSLSDKTRKIQFKRSPQSSILPITTYEKAAASRRGTRIARIFTDPRVSASSAQSAFYCPPSAFYCVHPRLIFSRKTQEALAI
ncbi:MAG: hypothetical protein O8C61_08575 [Candidatus Methanoperedens sp.]|nr:hypothetical protein [Candidatus Methanoperedens sp.]